MCLTMGLSVLESNIVSACGVCVCYPVVCVTWICVCVCDLVACAQVMVVLLAPPQSVSVGLQSLLHVHSLHTPEAVLLGQHLQLPLAGPQLLTAEHTHARQNITHTHTHTCKNTHTQVHPRHTHKHMPHTQTHTHTYTYTHCVSEKSHKKEMFDLADRWKGTYIQSDGRMQTDRQTDRHADRQTASARNTAVRGPKDTAD